MIPVQILPDQDQVLVPRHQQQEVKVDLLLRGVHAPDPNHIRHRRLLARGLFQPQTVKPKRNLTNQNNYDGNEMCTVMSLKKLASTL